MAPALVPVGTPRTPAVDIAVPGWFAYLLAVALTGLPADTCPSRPFNGTTPARPCLVPRPCLYCPPAPAVYLLLQFRLALQQPAPAAAVGYF